MKCDVREIITLIPNHDATDVELITRAFNFAESSHSGITRYSGEPYINHPFETAKNLAELGMSSTTIAAGLLHDVLEDADITVEELASIFTEEIAFLVDGVTKLGKLKYRGSIRHSESLRKLFVAMSKDIRVIIIKLADRLHNIRTLEHVPEIKQHRIATETLEIYAPIAYRLGIRKLSRELENLSFPYVYPDDYKELKQLLKHKQNADTVHLEKFSKSLKKVLAKEGVLDIHTSYRIKSTYSLWKKLLHFGKNIDLIHDISAIRVIVPTVSDCYRVMGIIHGTWKPLPEKIKDYISFKKPNGYQSLHTTIFTGDGSIVEVQIKTEEMYRESEYGIASHISYKNSGNKSIHLENEGWVGWLLPKKTSGQMVENSPQFNTDVPKWIKELVEFQELHNSPEKFIKNIKDDFFSSRIFIFTPVGDVIDLPVNSTPIDFAYAIHSDIGTHTSGVNVNGKHVSLDTILNNGDRVEINTRPTSKPSPKWLTFVKTTLAQKHIRNFLEAEDSENIRGFTRNKHKDGKKNKKKTRRRNF